MIFFKWFVVLVLFVLQAGGFCLAGAMFEVASTEYKDSGIGCGAIVVVLISCAICAAMVLTAASWDVGR